MIFICNKRIHLYEAVKIVFTLQPYCYIYSEGTTVRVYKLSNGNCYIEAPDGKNISISEEIYEKLNGKPKKYRKTNRKTK